MPSLPQRAIALLDDIDFGEPVSVPYMVGHVQTVASGWFRGWDKGPHGECRMVIEGLHDSRVRIPMDDVVDVFDPVKNRIYYAGCL